MRPSYSFYKISMKIKIAEHLYEIYPAMPRYANDPE